MAQVLAGQLRPALFLEIEFLTETVWLWNGFGTMTPGGPAVDPNSSFPYGQTFLGMGWMGEVRSVPQVADVVAQGLNLTLSGIPAELVSDAINAVRQNSIATLWLGCLDSNNGVIGDPVQIFQGSLDVPTLSEGAETATISISCENPLIDLNRPPNRRFTDVDQQFMYNGDLGFFQVQLLQDYNFTWPSPVSNSSSQTASPPNFLTITPGVTGPVEVEVGATVQLTCVCTNTDGTTGVVMGPGEPSPGWGGPAYSSDPSIATVDETGLVTGVREGMCIITKMFVEGGFLGGGTTNTPSNAVTASVTIIVSIPSH